ncbi:MAG TPA: elongation factor P [Myxococcota bacterium]|nr:elongation factor P [Myxococcota bacterium]HRY95137.1 elongation factor P [Myxococcota bacterium]
MYETSEFRRGLKIEINGEPFVIIEFQHIKPGKGNAFTRTKIKSLLTGNVLEPTFKSGDKVGRPDLEEKEMQFLYREGDAFHFMDTKNYEQQSLDISQMQGNEIWLVENTMVDVLFHNNKPITLEVPTFVELKVKKTDPGLRGDTATGGTKPATMETGAVVSVPLFVNEGERIRIDTRTGMYMERVK